MNVYIAGPMKGHKDLNAPAFFEVEKVLKAQGYGIFNPANLPTGLTINQYMSIDLAMLTCAEAIYLLPNWERSEGAQAEYALAVRLDLIIIKGD